MEIKRFVINENEFEFVCDSWETSNAWGHKVVLFKNGVEVAENKVRYYNRTWEGYRYQSCMLGCISQLKEKCIERWLNKYKTKNNITRFRKGEKEFAIECAKRTDRYLELEKLYEGVSRDCNYEKITIL